MSILNSKSQKFELDTAKKEPKFDESYRKVNVEYQLLRQVFKTRKEMGLTQSELAQKISVKQQIISRFENEKHIQTI